MVKLEDAVIARLEFSGDKFELLVDPYIAMDLKHGKQINFDDLVAATQVFNDARKGDEKNSASVKKVFGSMSFNEIVKKIVLDGDVQLTTVQRREMVEKRRNEIINFISRNAVNPQLNAPHPPKRIELALEEAKFSVDLNKNFNQQVEMAIKELKKILPLSMDKLKIAVRISAAFSGRASSILHKYNVIKEEWQNDGSLVGVVEIPAGVKQDLFNELNHLTHGDFESKLLEDK